MQKMKTLGSIYISNLDPKIKERILELDVDKEKLKKFSDLEKFEKVSTLNDLKDLLTHTETEVLNTLNSLYNNSQFFTYCGPILVNINPGPGRVYDYLNLQKWMAESNKTDDARWKPHLYAYINYIYQTLCTEKKDQVVNLLGQIGSGKTFNLIHIIEYLTLLAGPENLQVELFDMIHKSIQLIHIMGSIYRQNNVESTCCGLLLKLSFDDDNKLCNFDIESKIVDFTLPFSENGRSYTILHALMCANSDLKKSLELPDSEQNLNFFKKFNKNFDAKTKEKFKMNDLEIWTRFHSLLNYFGFQKNEIFEILQLFSFIILLNECAIGRKKSDGCEEFFLNKSLITKKVAKNLNISEENLLIKIGVYKSINDLKSALIKLMKYTYFLIFEYIKSKVKRYSNKYFEILKEDSTINKTVNNLKSLYFIDIPSEIDDQTLGGLSTNLINECLNLFASNQYLSLVEKLEKEKINIKFIQPLHCVDVVNSLIGENGLGRLLSKKFNDKLFYKFKSYCNSIPHLRKTIEFSEPENLVEGTKPDQYIFRFKYSKKSVVYNLESLSLESRSMSFSKRLLNILELSNNKILKIVLKKDIKVNFLKPKTFFHFLHHTISEIFSPLQDLSPFLIYCFHSNNSLKIFFGETIDNKPNWNIPEKLTTDLCKHSLLMPVLYWEWFGYHEWISIDDFVDQFGVDFENIKDKLLLLAKAPKGRTKSAVSFNQLKKDEICLFILTILLGEKQFLLGQNYILLKKGFLKDIRKILDNLAEIHKINRKTASIERRESKIDKKEDSKEIKSRKSVSNAKEEVSKKGIKSQMSLIKKKDSAQGIEPLNDIQKNVPLLKKNSLKILCHYKIINEKNDKGSREQPYYYNLFKFLVLPSPETILNNSIDGMNNVNEIKPKEDMKVVDDYINNNNVIVVNNLNTFNAFKNVLKADSNNYELFDYSDYIFEISKIQSCYRAFRARKRYKIFRYVIRKIILMQRYIRAWVIRSKLKRYISVTKKVTKIQKVLKIN